MTVLVFYIIQRLSCATKGRSSPFMCPTHRAHWRWARCRSDWSARPGRFFFLIKATQVPWCGAFSWVFGKEAAELKRLQAQGWCCSWTRCFRRFKDGVIRSEFRCSVNTGEFESTFWRVNLKPGQCLGASFPHTPSVASLWILLRRNVESISRCLWKPREFRWVPSESFIWKPVP